MKVKIRYGVFETNSSSMHSICIMKNQKPLTLEKNIYLYCEGYERAPFQVLFTPEEKMDYAICCLHSGNYTENKLETEIIEPYTEMLQKYDPDGKIENRMEYDRYRMYYRESEPDVLYSEFDERLIYKPNIDVYIWRDTKEIMNPTGKDRKAYHISASSSSELFRAYLNEEGITEEEFIFNPKYFVVIDGDEYMIFDSMLENGLITNVEHRSCEYNDKNF